MPDSHSLLSMNFLWALNNSFLLRLIAFCKMFQELKIEFETFVNENLKLFKTCSVRGFN